MSDWVVGDIHGCRRTFDDLLKAMDFAEGRDRLFSVGDLVNRGPDTLSVLRWFSQTDGVNAVLGNHDLHLLARAAGIRKFRSEDRFEELLSAPDSDELLEWLQARPLVSGFGGNLIVHAGLLPRWDFGQTQALASECSEQLRTRGVDVFFGPTREPRLSEIIQVMTRLRIVDPDGRPDFDFVQGLEQIPEGKRPWFEGAVIFEEMPRILFGHWAMLGLYRGDHCMCLDSGCIYGGGLSALEVESDEIVTVSTRRVDLWRP